MFPSSYLRCVWHTLSMRREKTNREVVQGDRSFMLLHKWKVPFIRFYLSKLCQKRYQWCCCTKGMSSIHNSVTRSSFDNAKLVTDVKQFQRNYLFDLKQILQCKTQKRIVNIHLSFLKIRNLHIRTEFILTGDLIFGTLYHSCRRNNSDFSCLALL